MRTAVLVIALTTCALALADDSREEAKHHFNEAEKQFQLGHYAEAAKEYEAGYALFPRPGFLFDIAQSYRKLGDSEKALHFYKQYVLNAVPGPKTAVHVQEAQEQIKILEPLVAAQEKAKSSPPDGVTHTDVENQSKAPAPAPSPPPASPSAPPAPLAQTIKTPPSDASAPRAKRIAGLAVGGFGVLSLALGGMFTGLASDANGHILTGDTWNPSAQQRRDAYQALDVAFFTIGGAAVATGVVLYLIGRHDARRQRTAASIVPFAGSGAVGVSLVGSVP